jgi:hypothetical protein
VFVAARQVGRGVVTGTVRIAAKVTPASEVAPGCFEVVVVEATAAARTKISISAAHRSSWVEWNTPTLK